MIYKPKVGDKLISTNMIPEQKATVLAESFLVLYEDGLADGIVAEEPVRISNPLIRIKTPWRRNND